MAHSPIATIENGCLVRADFGLLVTSIDSLPQSDWIFSRVRGFHANSPWSYVDYDEVIVSVAYQTGRNLRCVLSREGQVNLYGPGGQPDRTYQIADAGVMREGAPGYGYVNRIRAIGSSIYVCGMSRQVYRFAPGTPDVLGGTWVDIAGAMRQPVPSDPPEGDGEEFDRWLDESDTSDLVDIAGSSESDIYAAGDECWHFDGNRWQQLRLPTDEFINAIKAVDANNVLLVGHNGTLLQGSAKGGWTDLSAVEDNQNFTGVEVFGDLVFLASNLGLYVYDPKLRRIEKYATTLTPDLQDTHMLEAKDAVLWSFGFKDLAWFDGKQWVRVDHPDNPPIR